MQFRQAKQSFPPHSTLTTFQTIFFFCYLYMLLFIIHILGNSELIDRVIQRGRLLSNKEWELHAYNSSVVTISYKIRVICDADYYGNRCKKFCLARNDNSGHYTCDKNGNKVCLFGWRGERCDTGIKFSALWCMSSSINIFIASTLPAVPAFVLLSEEEKRMFFVWSPPRSLFPFRTRSLPCDHW